MLSANEITYTSSCHSNQNLSCLRLAFIIRITVNGFQIEHLPPTCKKMFFSDRTLFVIVMVNDYVLISLFTFLLVRLSKIKSGFYGANRFCHKMNWSVRPILNLHSLMTFLLLVHQYWFLALFNMPMWIWLAYDIVTSKRDNKEVYDPTEIWQRLGKCFHKCLVQLGYYLLFFMICFSYLVEAIIYDY